MNMLKDINIRYSDALQSFIVLNAQTEEEYFHIIAVEPFKKFRQKEYKIECKGPFEEYKNFEYMRYRMIGDAICDIYKECADE